MTDRAVTLLVLLAVASLGWWLLSRRDGRFRPAASGASAGDVLDAAELGGPLTGHATFFLVSSATCSTCPQVRRVLSAMADAQDGYIHTGLESSAKAVAVDRLAYGRAVAAEGVVAVSQSGEAAPRAAAPHIAAGGGAVLGPARLL